MHDPKFETRLPATNFVVRHAAVLGAALMLSALGCKGPVAADGNVELQSSAVANPSAPVTKAAVVSTASKAKSSNPTVWVILKTQANPAPAAKGKDWKGKGQAVFSSLTSTASTSQAGLKSFLGSRGAKFKSFWIVNTLKVTADQQTIDEIAKRSDVAKVVPDRSFSLPPRRRD